MFPVYHPYKLPSDVLPRYTDKPVPWGFGTISQVVYYRTYSRPMDDGYNEHWPDTVKRVVEGVMTIRKTWYKMMGQRWDDSRWNHIAERMFDAIFHMRMLPPGRGLWAMGTDKVYEIGNAALNNCAYVTIKDLAKDTAWHMDQLMLGVGVGFDPTWVPSYSDRQFQQPLIHENIENAGEYIQKALLGKIPNGSGGFDLDHAGQELADELFETYGIYIIPDTREGWTDSVETLIRSYTVPGSNHVVFNYDLIRPAGNPIKGFGGKASGPGPLEDLHEWIRMDFTRYVRGEIDLTELFADINNQVGACVIAGNVRRSAQIALGSLHNDTFMNLKNIGKFSGKGDDKVWVPGPKANRASWSWLSNNSVRLSSDDDFLELPAIAQGIIDRGEPGMANMINIQKYARYGRESEDRAVGMNPCGEIPLEDYELCNLVEVFPTRCGSVEDLNEALFLATVYASSVSLLPSHDERTNAVVGRNRRIGVSVSGVADWLDATDWPTIHRLLDDGYDLVKNTNRQLAVEAGVPPSIRVTTIKPSGSVSLLAGVSSGMHHPEFRYGLRRIDVDINHPVAERLLIANVPYEHKVLDQNTMRKDPNTLQFEFPMEFGNSGTRAIDEVSVWEQGAILAGLQRVWSDNAVSNTLKIKPEEFDQLERFLAVTAPVVKSLAMLVPDDGQYVGMPFEKESRDKYRGRIRDMEDVDWSGFRGSDGEDTLFCEGDACVLPF